MQVNRTSRGAVIGGVLTIAVLGAVIQPAGAQGAQVAQTVPPVRPASAAGAAVAGSATTDRIIVAYDSPPPGPGARVGSLAEAAGVPLEPVASLADGAIVVKLSAKRPEAEVAAVAARIAASPGVAYAEPDDVMQATAAPSDPLYPQQWHYGFEAANSWGANLQPAWDITTGGPVVVAVIDTGRRDATDLAGKLLDGADMIADAATANDGDGRDADETDPGDWSAAGQCGAGSPPRSSSWHATHVAGTIGAVANNGQGGSGVSWGAKVLHVRVLGRCGGWTSDVADGIRWAAGLSVPGVADNPTPAKIINLSLGGSGTCSATYQAAIDAAVNAGAVLSVAAGNSAAPADSFQPANCNNVITVAGGDRQGNLAFYSNYSTGVVEITAPGGETSPSAGDGVLSTLNSGTTTPGSDNFYAFYQGTSMAAPHVAGVLALMATLQPAATPAQLTTLLLDNTRPFKAGGDCATYLDCGRGWLDAGRVLQAMNPVPTVSIGDVAVAEGAVQHTVTVPITLSRTKPTAVVVKYRTVAGGTAVAGSDYVNKTVTSVTIPANTLTANATFAVKGDKVVEPDETVHVQLTAATGATLADALGVVTLTNDDTAAPAKPAITVDDPSVVEANSGQRALTFTVSLSAASTKQVTVKVKTANGTALSGSDYVARALSTITFTPGQTTKTFVVQTKGDTVVEADETFLLNLSAPVNATLGETAGTGQIVNND